MEPIYVVRPQRRPWQIYTILLILLIAGPVVFYEWLRHWDRVLPGMPATEPNGWIAAKSDSRMQAAAAFKPIMDIQVIAEATPRASLVNMPVQLTGGVRSIPDGNGFWVSQGRTEPVFVAFASGALRGGEKVELTGTIRALPDRDEIGRRWPGLKGRDLHRLEQQALYIEAGQVTPAGQW